MPEQLGLRLLCLDGGGIRGLSSLLILERIMYRIKAEQQLDSLPLPCDYFDLIGGTSTGGLIALMLGRLRMPVEDAIEAYNQLAQEVFSDRKPLWQDGKFKASLLEAAIKKIVGSSSSVNEKELMKDPRENACRTVVSTQSAHNLDSNVPVLLRTYDSPDEPAMMCTIWEAAHATCAAPGFFKPIKIGPEVFIEGLGHNNPTDWLLHEAQTLFPERGVACVVSIGTGLMKDPPSKPRLGALQPGVPTQLISELVAIATDCNKKHLEMETRFKPREGVYFRFNVDQGIEAINMEWLPKVKEYTTAYTAREMVRLNEVARALITPDRGIGIL